MRGLWCQCSQIQQLWKWWLGGRCKGSNGFSHRGHHSIHKRKGKLRIPILVEESCTIRPTDNAWLTNWCNILMVQWYQEHENKASFKRVSHLSPNRDPRGFLVCFVFSLFLRASPNFSVTTHSLALFASSKPINVALVRWKAITFSKRIQ